MAYSTTAIDTNRATDYIELPPAVSSEILGKAVEESAVMQLAQRIALPGRGLSIPVIMGDAEAAFIGESTEKHVGAASIVSKTMTPYKVAVIELFSDEFRRDLPALYDEIIRRAPAAIGKKFDATIFNGSAPGTGFDVLSGCEEVALDGGTSEYLQLVEALKKIGAAGGELNGFAMSAQGRAALLAAVDGGGRPIFNAAAEGAVPRVLGAPVAKAQAAYAAAAGDNGDDIVGFAGDWSLARYGIVDGIKVEFSNQATINDGTNQINLWQRNMFAVRIEAEVGFVCADDKAFVKLTVAPVASE